MMKCSISIKDCKKGTELWPMIASKVQVMLDNVEDGSAFVIFEGCREDGLDVIEKCLRYGTCEVSASFHA